MKRTQVQIPDPLYQDIRRVAALQGWSIAEVLRRGAEYIVRCHPPFRTSGEWEPPAPRHLGAFRAPADQWRELANERG